MSDPAKFLSTGDAGLAWPTTLYRPEASPQRWVYLDLNHFIYLARSVAGDPTTPPGYDDLWATSCAAVKGGRVLFPLSAVHVFEMTRIKDPRQRRDVASVMERLSSFQYLLGHVEVARHEIEAAFDAALGTTTSLPRTPLIRTGVAYAFGKELTWNVRNEDGSDASQAIRARVGDEEYEALRTRITLEGERGLLTGPADKDLPALRKSGYAPERAFASTDSRLAFEQDLTQRLSADQTNWRAGRPRDVIAARELTHEWNDLITRSAMARDTTIGQAVGAREEIRAFAESMPANRVTMTLKERYHRNPQHVWRTNDIHDIDALSVAYPYCDVVFTDKAARNALSAAKELRPFGTYLPRRVAELTTWIDDAIAE